MSLEASIEREGLVLLTESHPTVGIALFGPKCFLPLTG